MLYKTCSLTLMSPSVLIQNSFLPKVLSTLGTLIGLLSSMNPQMLIEYSPLPEVPAAIYTPIWLLVGVNSKVLCQVRLLSKPLPAFRTRIRPGFYVYAAVL